MEQIIFFDGTFEMIGASRHSSAVVPIMPGIPLRFTWDWHREGIAQEVLDSPLGNMAMQIYQTATDSTSGSQQMGLIWKHAYDTPLIYEEVFSPSLSFMWLRITCESGGAFSYGFPTISAVYEVMPEAAYNRLMRAKRVTGKQIEAVASQIDEHGAAKVVAEAKKTQLEEEEVLWDNFLSDEIAQYEVINPPE